MVCSLLSVPAQITKFAVIKTISTQMQQRQVRGTRVRRSNHNNNYAHPKTCNFIQVLNNDTRYSQRTEMTTPRPPDTSFLCLGQDLFATLNDIFVPPVEQAWKRNPPMNAYIYIYIYIYIYLFILILYMM